MRYLLNILTLLMGLVVAPLAVASDLTISRAVLEDKPGTLTIADVAGREFKPVKLTLSKGFTDSAHWLRLRIKAPAKGSQVVLFIRQPFLNEIRLYEPDPGTPSGWKTRVTGNYYPYSERERARSSLGFVVNVTAPEETFFLRLKTKTVSQLTVEALEPAEAERQDDQFDLLAVFFTTAMLLLLIWAIHSYLLDRLPVVWLFAVNQFMYTWFGIAITGYLAPLIPSRYPLLAELSTAIPYCAATFTTLLFCRELFKPYQPPAAMMRGINLFLLVFPLQLSAMALGHTPLAVIVNALLVRVTWWYLFIMTFTLRKEYSPSRRQLQLFFFLITLVFTLFWLSTRSSSTGLQNNLYGRQMLIANGLIIGGLFAMILNARSRRLQQEAQQSALELKTRSEFFALVSHEIRTPLNALVGFSTLARTATDPAKLDQYHVILEQSSRSLMELTNNILDMSKIEAGRMDIGSLPFNLRQFLANIDKQYQSLAEQKGLAFQFVVADDVPIWVLGDPVRLRQVLVNLLANALKFTDSGALSLTVSLAERALIAGQPLVRFEVKDTGIGISANWLSQLFQPFHQLDPSVTRSFGGTGLGLAIVQSLTKMMGGTITVDSQEGMGSSFVVELPLQITDAVSDEGMPPVVIPPGLALVVEDNAYNRRLLEDILTDWGHQVTLAEDGRQGLHLLETQRFSFVILDLRMPEIDGIEVAHQVRCRERQLSESPVPIIAITADADAATRETCLAAGINEVLAKPVVPEQLALAIATLCGGINLTASLGEELQLNVQTCSDLGDNPERARQYREMLRQDIDEELSCLQAALERNERHDFARSAHTLKGLCGHLANKEPAELAAWLQQSAPTGNTEQMQLVIEQLRTMCQYRLVQEDAP